MHRLLNAAIVISATIVTARPSQVDACTVAGEKVEFGVAMEFDQDVVVRPLGESSFRLTSLFAERLVATIPSRPQARTKIDVHGVIGFSATTGALAYTVERTVEVSDGMVKLYRGATLSHASATNDHVVTSVDIHGGAETLESVPVPCDALTLKVRLEPSVDKLVSGDGTWWRPKGNVRRFTVRARPEERAHGLVLVVREPDYDSDRLCFQRLAVRGAWTHVAREGFKVAVTGWAPTVTLEKLANPPEVTGVSAGSLDGPGYVGHGRSGRMWFYEGAAHVVVGTTIFAAPGRGPWATVEKDAVFQVRYSRDAAFAQVTGIPGVAGPRLSAFVPVTALTGEARPSGAGQHDR